MTTEQIKARIVEIDGERNDLYRKGGKYMGTNGKPKTGFELPGVNHYGPGPLTAKTNGEAWGYIKGRYAELMREREALAAKLGVAR